MTERPPRQYLAHAMDLLDTKDANALMGGARVRVLHRIAAALAEQDARLDAAESDWQIAHAAALDTRGTLAAARRALEAWFERDKRTVNDRNDERVDCICDWPTDSLGGHGQVCTSVRAALGRPAPDGEGPPPNV